MKITIQVEYPRRDTAQFPLTLPKYAERIFYAFGRANSDGRFAPSIYPVPTEDTSVEVYAHLFILGTRRRSERWEAGIYSDSMKGANLFRDGSTTALRLLPFGDSAMLQEGDRICVGDHLVITVLKIE